MNNFFLSLKRTPYQTLANILVLFFSLFLISVILIFSSFLNGFLNYVESKPQVTVYFKPNTDENYIAKLKEEINQTNKVANIIYIDQKKAFEIYKNLNKDNPLLLEMVSPETMPASLEIYPKKPKYLEEIANSFKNKDNIDEVQYQADIIEKLLNINRAIRIGSLIFVIYLTLMTILVITTTTWFKISLKKEEIDLLRLLGASNFYIIKPYLNENFFLATTTSLTSFLLILGVIFYFNPFIKNYLAGINELFLDLNFIKLNIWPLNFTFLSLVFGVSWLFSVIICLFSTYLATNKYLKV